MYWHKYVFAYAAEIGMHQVCSLQQRQLSALPGIERHGKQQCLPLMLAQYIVVMPTNAGLPDHVH
jgi:hypothetical protein